MKWADFFHADTNLGKPRVWEKSGSWDMGQNTLGQSDYRIFKSTISLEQNDEKVWFFHVGKDSWNIEVDWKLMGWAWSKMGLAIIIGPPLVAGRVLMK